MPVAAVFFGIMHSSSQECPLLKLLSIILFGDLKREFVAAFTFLLPHIPLELCLVHLLSSYTVDTHTQII